MSNVDTMELDTVVNAVMAALLRDGRIPTRLDAEDMNDLRQEGLMAALVAYPSHDPRRGSLRAYLGKPIARAILREAWKIANAGITGDHGSLQVHSHDADVSFDAPTGAYDLPDSLVSDDVADEVEAFDFVWKTYFLHDST